MATRKYGATTRSPTAPRAPPQRNFSSILPNLPIQFSGRLLANARPQSLDEREVLFRAGDVADGCYRLEQGPAQGQHRFYKVVQMKAKAPLQTLAEYDEALVKDMKLPVASTRPVNNVVQTVTE